MRFIDVWNVLERNEKTRVNVHILDPHTKEENSCIILTGTNLPSVINDYEIFGLRKSTCKKRTDRIIYECYVWEKIVKEEKVILGKLVTLWNNVAPDNSILQVDFTLDCDCPTLTFNEGQFVPGVLYWTAIQSIFIDLNGRLTILLQE